VLALNADAANVLMDESIAPPPEPRKNDAMIMKYHPLVNEYVSKLAAVTKQLTESSIPNDI
jgi:hypothetical protein